MRLNPLLNLCRCRSESAGALSRRCFAKAHLGSTHQPTDLGCSGALVPTNSTQFNSTRTTALRQARHDTTLHTNTLGGLGGALRDLVVRTVGIG